MIANLKPYRTYKESGLPWLDQVPAHWELISNRGLVRRRKMLVGKRHSQYRLLSLTKQGVIVRDVSTGKGKFSLDMGTSQEVRSGDLVFCLFDVPETPRTVGLSQHDGMITGAYTVFEYKHSGTAEYFELFYRAMDDRKLLSPLYSGLRNTIPSERFLGTKTPHPPPIEQAAIVRFLHWASSRLERTIRAKQNVILLLNEQKQAIVHRAVTRGLDASVSYKSCSLPWLQTVPAHWDVKPLKHLLLRMDYGTSENARGEGKVRVLTMGHIRDGKVVLPEKGGLDSVPTGLLLEKNDLLFNRTNSPELVGKVGLFTGDANDKATFASYLVRLRVSSDHNPIWLNYLLNSKGFWSYARSQALISLHQANLNSKRYGQMALPIPPTRAEQDKIVNHVRLQAGGIERAVTRLEREIDLLREYRTRLVSDVVTGKLDVREAATRLPDEKDIADEQAESEEDRLLEDAEADEAEAFAE